MNADFINPFLHGAQNILNSICGENPKLGSLFVKESPYICEPVSIEIGIVGDLKGNVVYTMKSEVACYIASKMMFGMEVLELDDMSKSAISELGNMISGNVATIFSGNGKMIDITTPQFRIGASNADFNFIDKNSKVICMPLNFQDGSIFEVDILILEHSSI